MKRDNNSDTITLSVDLAERYYKTLCMEAESRGKTPEEWAGKLLQGHLLLSETSYKLKALEEEQSRRLDL